MSYDASKKKITAPVGFPDIQNLFGVVANDLGTLMEAVKDKINRWAKYKPLKLGVIDTVTGQWNASANTWRDDATWWQGSDLGCGFTIPSAGVATEYRGGQTYNYQNAAMANCRNINATPPAPLDMWVWRGIDTIYRMTDFAGYLHDGPQAPWYIQWPVSGSTFVFTNSSQSALSIGIVRRNGSIRDSALYYDDMTAFKDAEMCVLVQRGSRKIFERAVKGLTVQIFKSDLMVSASDQLGDNVTFTVYARIGNTLRSLNCDGLQTMKRTYLVKNADKTYKILYSLSEDMTHTPFSVSKATDAWYNGSMGDYYRNLAFYVADNSTEKNKWAGMFVTYPYFGVRAQLYDVFGSGMPTEPVTVRVLLEDAEENDAYEGMIPTVVLGEFQLTAANNYQGYIAIGRNFGTSATFDPYMVIDENNDGWQKGNIPICLPVHDRYEDPEYLNKGIRARFRIRLDVVANDMKVMCVPTGQSGEDSGTSLTHRDGDTYSEFHTFVVRDVEGIGMYDGYETKQWVDSDYGMNPRLIPTLGWNDSLDADSDLSHGFKTTDFMPVPSNYSANGSQWNTEA